VVARGRLRRASRRVKALLARRRHGAQPGADTSDLVHDFRVALRRLRSWLRACRGVLDDTVRRGRLRDLRTLSRRAGRVRDLEVQLALLRELGGSGTSLPATAARLLADRCRDQHGRALLNLDDALADGWPRLAAALDEELAHYFVEVRLEGSVTPTAMGPVLGAALREYREELLAALTPVPRMAQVRELHRARIAAKHLRYVLEAFDARPRARAALLDLLRTLQDEVGELHDAQMLDELIAAFAARKSRDGMPSRQATAALTRLVRRRIRGRFGGAHRAMIAVRRAVASDAIESLARRCEAAAGGRQAAPGNNAATLAAGSSGHL